MKYANPAIYLPHTAPMILLDRVIDVAEKDARCEVATHPDGLLSRFFDASGNLPSWYAIEIMAQTIGVWFGWHQSQITEYHPEVGLLLGGRSIKFHQAFLPANAVLTAQIHLQFMDNNIGNFECSVNHQDNCLASGRLTTYQPSSAELDNIFNRNNKPD